MPEENKSSEVAPSPTPKRKIKKIVLWQAATFILVIALIFLFINYNTSAPSPELPQEEAVAKAVNFMKTNLLQGQTVAVESINEEGGIYNLKLKISGQPYEGYLSKNGELFFPRAVKLTETPQSPSSPQQDSPPPQTAKSDQPKVELFVMSHCPFGTQSEKGFLPVVEKLGGKIDFEIKFVYYAMHGEKEVKEQMAQVCLQKEQKEKFLPYLTCFLKEGDGEKCLTEAQIDSEKLSSCLKALDAEYKITEKLNDQSTWLSGRFPLFDVHKAENEKYGIGGSPALVINSQQVSSERSPSAYLAAVCAAFNQPPEECQTSLSTASFSPGFGYEGTGTANSGSCG